MPSRSNPNTPTRQKPKTSGAIQKKRKHVARAKSLGRQAKTANVASVQNPSKKPSSLQKAISNGDVKIQQILRTSQALKQAEPLSGKKLKKLSRQARYGKKREEEAAAKEEAERLAGKGDVKMKDVSGVGVEEDMQWKPEEMEIDEV